jgi:phytanoyl-CoA dioxygenase PhyH
MPIPQDQLDRWLFEFKLNGFIVIKDLLPLDLVDAMNVQFLEILALEEEMARRGDPLSGRGKDRYAVSIGSLVEKSGGPLNDARARRPPLVEELVSHILGPWRYSKLIVECPCPGSGYMGWHIDSYHASPEDRARPKRTTQLKLQVPLVDVTDDRAPMEVLPGSHRMHYYEGDEAVKALPAVYCARLLMSRGDGFLRDGDLVHRGTPNRSDVPRPLYSQTYKSLPDGGQRTE